MIVSLKFIFEFQVYIAICTVQNHLKQRHIIVNIHFGIFYFSSKISSYARKTNRFNRLYTFVAHKSLVARITRTLEGP